MGASPIFQMREGHDDLFKRARAAAAKRGQSLAAWIKDAMRASLEVSPARRRVVKHSPAGAGGTSNDCPHNNKQVLSFMTRCLDCGERLR